MPRILAKNFKDTIQFLEFVEIQKQKALKKGPLGPNNLIDLTNIKLDVPKPWLAFVNLSWCHLKKINLEGANLQEANLQGTNLENANLKGAQLNGAYLQGAQLQGVLLQHCQMNKANLRVANLRSSDLRGASLEGCDLQLANLQGSFLQKADLKNCNLQGANLQGADLKKSDISKSILIGANLQWCDLQDANLNGSDLQESDFQESNLTRANFTRANLEGANFAKTVLFRAKGLQSHLHSLTLPSLIQPINLGKVKSNYKYASNRDRIILKFLSTYYKMNPKAPKVPKRSYLDLMKILNRLFQEYISNRSSEISMSQVKSIKTVLNTLRMLLELSPSTVKIYDALTVILPFIQEPNLFRFRQNILLRFFPDPPTAKIFRNTVRGLWLSHTFLKVTKLLTEEQIHNQSVDSIHTIFECMLLGLKGIWRSVDFVLDISAFAADSLVIYNCLRKEKMIVALVNELRHRGIPKDITLESDDPFLVGSGPTHKNIFIECCHLLILKHVNEKIRKFAEYDSLAFAAFEKARIYEGKDIIFYIEEKLKDTLNHIEYIYLTETEDKAALNGKNHVNGKPLRFYVQYVLRMI